tara:strand:- start:397 stop:1350 length:954 start_codon:yes stop_codon:yes gene_type:complete
MISYANIKKAKININKFINRTPQIRSLSLSNLHQDVFLKLESMQITGSFKFRGAMNKLLSLNIEQKKKGVIAVSTGNHGKGVAYAAKILGIHSKIFMSELVPSHRRKAIESLGAEIEIRGKNSDEADKYAKDYSNKNNIQLIHPFDDVKIIEGQGTIGLEMLEDLKDVDTVIVPTSGGGLIGGIATVIKKQNSKTKIIGVSMKKGPSMYESLKAGKPVNVIEEETLADCLGGSIGLDNKYTFKIAQNLIDDFVLIDEEKIAEGIRFNFDNHKIITEGAAATGIMVVKDKLSKYLGKKIICLICGGNIDSQLFSKILK